MALKQGIYPLIRLVSDSAPVMVAILRKIKGSGPGIFKAPAATSYLVLVDENRMRSFNLEIFCPGR